MVEAHEDHHLVQLQERQAAIEVRSFLSFFESSIALLEASCHPRPLAGMANAPLM